MLDRNFRSPKIPSSDKKTEREEGQSRLKSLLVLVQADAARAQGHNEQEAADHGQGLKEVVLEEVVERLI